MDRSPKAVFLSYASEDADAAARLASDLRASGLEVWFDQNELRGGEAWDASIRKQIDDCVLFVPLISANTDARGEGYFRLEWRLAVERSLLMADDQPFLLPVVIDDTHEKLARVPPRFRERHWTRLPAGVATPEFTRRASSLLAGTSDSARAAPGASAAAPPAAPRRLQSRPLLLGAAGLAVVACLVLGWWSAWRPVNHAATSTHAVPSGALDPNTIAVLPFGNLSGRAEDAYLADGLQEEVLNSLSKIRGFRVISRSSVMAYQGKTAGVREIGQRLGAGTLLEGSVRREGDTLRLTVQLIDANNDRQILATNYDRQMTHLLDLQSAVARLVANSLAATLNLYEKGELDRVATNSGDAYDRYLQALALFRRPTPHDQSGLLEPMRLLDEAVHIDPEFVDAIALLSQAHTWSYFIEERDADGVAAREAFERALAIDPKLPEARLARGLYAMYVSKDVEQALVDLEAVVELRPNAAEAQSVIGFALRRRGRMDQALAHLRHAADLDPLNPVSQDALMNTLMGLRRYDEAISQANLVARQSPGDINASFPPIVLEAQLTHRPDLLREGLREHGDSLDPNTRMRFEAMLATLDEHYLDAARIWEKVDGEEPLDRAVLMGVLYFVGGDTGRAGQIWRVAEKNALEQIKQHTGPVNLESLALVQSMLGEDGAALALIDQVRARTPESRDAVNGPRISLTRSLILLHAGRKEEAYAEAARLEKVPFGAPSFPARDPDWLLIRNDRHYTGLVTPARL